jgi:hypothetical protein
MGTNNNGRDLIPFTIINNSGLHAPAFLYMFGTTNPEAPRNNTCYLSDLKGGITKFPPNVKGKIYGLPLTGSTVKAQFPQLDAVRIYISFGSQLKIDTNEYGIPIAVSADDSTTPNYQTLWDFVEGTWHKYDDPQDPRTILHVNTTQVDAFGLAFKVEYSGFNPSKDKRTDPLTIVNGFDSDTARENIFRDLQQAGDRWNKLIIGSLSPRALMPLKAIEQSLFPEDQLADYIKAVSKFYLNTTSNRLIFKYVGVNYTGQTQEPSKDNFVFVFTPDKAKDNDRNDTFTYIIKVPTTRQVYANTIYLGLKPRDKPGLVGEAICAALGASYCRSTLTFYPNAHFPVPQENRSDYYQKAPIFEYARIIHSYGIDNHAFCYGYDEVAGDAGINRDVRNPIWLRLTIKGVGTMKGTLYVANYGTVELKKYVGPQNRSIQNPAFEVTVGPRSFVPVTTQQVTLGPPPWQVTANPTGPYLSDTNVTSLPAAIAFGVPTSIAYYP